MNNPVETTPVVTTTRIVTEVSDKPVQITTRWWKSKTLQLNAIGIAVLIVTYFLQNEMFPSWAAYETLVLAVLNMILRFITDSKITK